MKGPKQQEQYREAYLVTIGSEPEGVYMYIQRAKELQGFSGTMTGMQKVFPTTPF
jgi:hypothetical protein